MANIRLKANCFRNLPTKGKKINDGIYGLSTEQVIGKIKASNLSNPDLELNNIIDNIKTAILYNLYNKIYNIDDYCSIRFFLYMVNDDFVLKCGNTLVSLLSMQKTEAIDLVDSLKEKSKTTKAETNTNFIEAFYILKEIYGKYLQTISFTTKNLLMHDNFIDDYGFYEYIMNDDDIIKITGYIFEKKTDYVKSVPLFRDLIFKLKSCIKNDVKKSVMFDYDRYQHSKSIRNNDDYNQHMKNKRIIKNYDCRRKLNGNTGSVY